LGEHITSVFRVKKQAGQATSMKQAARRMNCLLFYPEDGGGSMFRQNIDELLPEYTASHSRRWYSSVFAVAFSVLEGESWLVWERLFLKYEPQMSNAVFVSLLAHSWMSSAGEY
jgi:hypothetical protein